MSDPIILPVQLPNLSVDDLIALEERSEQHDVAFGSPGVDLFTKDSIIRKAFAHCWAPSYEGESLSELLYHSTARGMNARVTDKYKVSLPVRVRILLTYPLHNPWEYTATIPSDLFGSVFGIAYDMYASIYGVDDAKWGPGGAERLAPNMLNRASGEHVWGHDMRDLVFERLQFVPNPEAKPITEKADPSADPSADPQFLGTVMFSIGS